LRSSTYTKNPTTPYTQKSVDPFNVTIMFGFNSFLQAQIDHGPSGNGTVNRDKSPLLTTIEFQNEILVRYRVENVADVSALGSEFGNPLQAAGTENAEIPRYLVENGAGVNARAANMGIHFKWLHTWDTK
jgi:hypothetical protein